MYSIINNEQKVKKKSICIHNYFYIASRMMFIHNGYQPPNNRQVNRIDLTTYTVQQANIYK